MKLQKSETVVPVFCTKFTHQSLAGSPEIAMVSAHLTECTCGPVACTHLPMMHLPSPHFKDLQKIAASSNVDNVNAVDAHHSRGMQQIPEDVALKDVVRKQSLLCSCSPDLPRKTKTSFGFRNLQRQAETMLSKWLHVEHVGVNFCSSGARKASMAESKMEQLGSTENRGSLVALRDEGTDGSQLILTSLQTADCLVVQNKSLLVQCSQLQVIAHIHALRQQSK